MKHALLLGLAFLVAGAAGCGKDEAKTPPAAAPAKDYPDGLDGFRALATDWIAAAKAGDVVTVKATVAAFKLPDAKAWFTAHFGDEPAARLDAEYTSYFTLLEGTIDGLVSVVKDEHRDHVEVRRHSDPTDVTATGYQIDAIRAMKKPQVLYTIQLRSAGATDPLDRVTLWSFVYVDGKYRIVGKMQNLAPEPDDETMVALKGLPVEDARKVLEEN